MARILTGIQSTGTPHLGNILGAILPAIKLSENSDNESYLFIANLHTLTQIKNAEDEARQIKGVTHLTIAKSQALIEMYSPGAKYTTDSKILSSFKNKENQLLEADNEEGHTLRMIKPMIATNDCLLCHANQAVGDVVGVMDLTFFRFMPNTTAMTKLLLY